MFKNLANLAIGLTVPAIVLFSLVPLQASTLTGSGTHLPIPGPNPGDPGGVPLTQVESVLDVGPISANWSAPAHTNWIGSLTATGPIPDGDSSGVTVYDFSTLPLGYLPAGTIFTIGDLDGGSTQPENVDLTAYDASNNEISLWLEEPIGIWGAPWPAGLNSVPGWDWNTTTTDAYNFTGGTVTGSNPSITVAMLSNQAITRLVVDKHTAYFGVGMRAPETVPEPSTLVLFGLGAVFLMGARLKRGKRS